MGPVSFSRLSFADRSEALDAARRLTAVGIRVQSTDDLSILVRGDDHAAAKKLLAGRERASPRSVQPLQKPFDAVVPLPGSKSHTNRALLCAALADGRSTLSRVLLADDTRAMLGALDRLGVGLRVDDERGPRRGGDRRRSRRRLHGRGRHAHPRRACSPERPAGSSFRRWPPAAAPSWSTAMSNFATARSFSRSRH